MCISCKTFDANFTSLLRNYGSYLFETERLTFLLQGHCKCTLWLTQMTHIFLTHQCDIKVSPSLPTFDGCGTVAAIRIDHHCTQPRCARVMLTGILGMRNLVSAIIEFGKVHRSNDSFQERLIELINPQKLY